MDRERGSILYFARSRRSGGISLGVNLFPDGKKCQFDCPYCEIFPFDTGEPFSLARMETNLRRALLRAKRDKQAPADICFSGCGEPTLSPFFPEALLLAARIRDEDAPGVPLRLITNGAGLLDPAIFALLRDCSGGGIALDAWIKVDSGASEWAGKINASAIKRELIAEKLSEFAALAPFKTQTMICAIDGSSPEDAERLAWESFLLDLARAGGANYREAQIYGKSRPAPLDPRASTLPDDFVLGRAKALRDALASLRLPQIPKVSVFL